MQDIKDTYLQAADTYATEMQKADIEAETERQKAYYSYLAKQSETEVKNNYIIKTNGANLSRNFVGSLKDNGVTVRYNSNGTTTYVDTRSGKSTTMDSKINPYTGKANEAFNFQYGAFSNGYQPKGVVINGKDYGAVSATTLETNIKGRKQTVWETPNGKLWYWDGGANTYKEYKITADEFTKHVDSKLNSNKKMSNIERSTLVRAMLSKQNFSESEFDYLYKYYGLF